MTSTNATATATLHNGGLYVASLVANGVNGNAASDGAVGADGVGFCGVCSFKGRDMRRSLGFAASGGKACGSRCSRPGYESPTGGTL